MKKDVENDMMDDLKHYFRCQKDICFKSKLFGGEIEEHGSKVVMLFAEMYSFLVDKYGINAIPTTIIQFQDSKHFKHWFWKVKHILGEEVLSDPSFFDIGKWIGKGLFLKMCLSITYYNHFLNDEKIIKQMIDKQKTMIRELLNENYFLKNGRKAIEIIDNGYILLKEKIILSYDSEYFYKENIIK
jgi:hypothetical protein